MRSPCFKLPDGRHVHFHLVAASTEQNNNKAAEGRERRFALLAEEFAAEVDGDLVLRFAYHPDPEKQAKLNESAVAAILAAPLVRPWRDELCTPASPNNDKRTLLEKRLAAYTARNTFDFFIHKDLGAFLRRELDFFLKTEILHLDDLAALDDARAPLALAKLRVLKEIGGTVITFLAQIEDFQKRLFLKKKFVVAADYCLTLDHVPAELYPTIISNDAQWEEWERLFAISAVAGGVTRDAAWLRANQELVLDTRFFDQLFKGSLLGVMGRLDEEIDGVLINSENFQALDLLQTRYPKEIKCIYIDPPYNTGNDEFLYKDNYQHSSWLSMMHDRLALSHALLSDDGCIMLSIDQEELAVLRQLLDMIFGRQNVVTTITVQRASVTGHKAINPGVVNVSEYVLIYAKDRNQWANNDVYSERDRDKRYSTFISNRTEDYRTWKFMPLADAFADSVGIVKNKLKRDIGDELDQQIDAFVFENANSVVQFATVDIAAVGENFRIAVHTSQEQPNEIVRFQRAGFADVYLLNGKRILFYRDKVAQIGERMATLERASDIWIYGLMCCQTICITKEA